MNLELTDNRAESGGGIYSWQSSPVLINVVLANNTATDVGSGMIDSYSAAHFVNVTFDGNRADSGGGYFVSHNAPELDNVLFVNNVATSDGGGISALWDANRILRNVRFVGNHAEYRGGAYYGPNARGVFADVTFFGNQAGEDGGAICGGPLIFGAGFVGNTAARGGALAAEGALRLENASLVRNRAFQGGALYTAEYDPVLLAHVALVDNMALARGGAVFAENEVSLRVVNSVFWGNRADQGQDLFEETPGTVDVSWSCLQGGWSLGTGNTSLAPDQIPYRAAASGQHLLLGGSGCVDTGDTAWAESTYLSHGLSTVDELYLKHSGIGAETHTSACVDIGDDAAANRAGIEWQAGTTRQDLAADTSPIDAGRHY